MSRVVVLLVVLTTLRAGSGAEAQAPDGPWGEAVNLSRSGAASDPQIVAGVFNTFQAFWWNRFDGLMTAVLADDGWSDPVGAPLQSIVQVGEEEFITVDLDVMPKVYSDGTGWIHAIWIGEPSAETQLTPLMRSRMRIGDAQWSTPVPLAEAAATFEAAQIPGGGLVVAYVRPSVREPYPAGLYLKTTRGGDRDWSAPADVHLSAYFRLLDENDGHIRVAATRSGEIYVAWDDPDLLTPLFARSLDNGLSFTEPEDLGATTMAPARPRVFALPDGGALRLWEAVGMGACTLQQQRLDAGGSPADWSAASPALDGLDTCPGGSEEAWPRGEALVWVWGGGSSSLTVAAWDVGGSRWSIPQTVELSLDDERTGRRVYLDDLHAARGGDRLAVVGVAEGDVWSTQNQVNAIDFVYLPASPWSDPFLVSAQGTPSGLPATAVDAAGQAHVVWPESLSAAEIGTSLVYARLSAAGVQRARPAVVVRGSLDEEMVRHPALAVDDNDTLHLVWSGGRRGEILYSRAKASEAGSLGGWSIPRSVPMPTVVGSWPQIVVDSSGDLTIAYAVPLNEARGIYVARSSDGGQSWSPASLAFDAEEAGWTMVDQPALAASDDGSLHLAFVMGAVPDTWRPQGVYYSQSRDGVRWTEPVRVAGPGAAWPRVVAGDGAVQLAYIEVDGGAWLRLAEADQADQAVGWGVAAPVPGLESVGGPVGVTAGGGGRVHVLGGGVRRDALMHSVWDGQQWVVRSGVPLGQSVSGVLGVAGASRSGSTTIAVAALVGKASGRETTPAIVVSVREIDGQATSESVTEVTETVPEQPEAPSPTEGHTEETTLPSATPDLSAGPPGTVAPNGPLVIGGGVAALAVVALLTIRSIRLKRQR